MQNRYFSYKSTKSVSALRCRPSFDPPQKKAKTLHSWREKIFRDFFNLRRGGILLYQAKVLYTAKLMLSNRLLFSVGSHCHYPTIVDRANGKIGLVQTHILCVALNNVLGTPTTTLSKTIFTQAYATFSSNR